MSSILRRSAALLLTMGLLSCLAVTATAGIAQAATRGFWIHNYTTKSVHIRQQQNQFDNRRYFPHDNFEVPANGTVITPGETLHVELDAEHDSGNKVWFGLDVKDDGGPIGKIELTLAVPPSRYVSYRDSWGKYYPYQGFPAMNLVTNSQDIYLYEPPGDIDVSRLSFERQRNFIGNMCDNGDADCVFRLTGERRPAWGESRDVIEPVDNFSCDNVEEKFKTVDKRELSNSWGIEFSYKAGVKGTWEAGIKVRYSGKYTTSHLFEKETTLTVRPAYRGRVVSTVPVWRYTGDFTVISHTDPRTRWTIKGITVDSPNSDGFTARDTGDKAIIQTLTLISSRISPAELAARDWNC